MPHVPSCFPLLLTHLDLIILHLLQLLLAMVEGLQTAMQRGLQRKVNAQLACLACIAQHNPSLRVQLQNAGILPVLVEVLRGGPDKFGWGGVEQATKAVMLYVKKDSSSCHALFDLGVVRCALFVFS